MFKQNSKFLNIINVRNVIIKNLKFSLVFIVFGIIVFVLFGLKKAEKTYYVNSVLWQVHSIKDGSNEGLVLLTIDDSPREETTVGFLDLLDKYEVKAIFFLNGYLCEAQPGLIEEILSRGHEVGNHTWQHRKLSELSREDAENEIIKLNKWLEQNLYYKPRFFRPPYGVATNVSDSLILKSGMKNMGWSVNSFDYEYQNDEIAEDEYMEIARRTLNGMDDGDIILMHDREISLRALEIIIEQLLQQGYIFIDPHKLL